MRVQQSPFETPLLSHAPRQSAILDSRQRRRRRTCLPLLFFNRVPSSTLQRPDSLTEDFVSLHVAIRCRAVVHSLGPQLYMQITLSRFHKCRMCVYLLAHSFACNLLNRKGWSSVYFDLIKKTPLLSQVEHAAHVCFSLHIVKANASLLVCFLS